VTLGLTQGRGLTLAWPFSLVLWILEFLMRDKTQCAIPSPQFATRQRELLLKSDLQSLLVTSVTF
jgi:hypothetical protein